MMLFYAGLKIELKDILLKDKPAEMIKASPKATVPVLILEDGTVLEESRDIMIWAAKKSDPRNLYPNDETLRSEIDDLLNETDGPFKSALDRYKYHVRFPEHPKEYYREQGEQFFTKLEERLSRTQYLLGENPTLADVGIFPFIRQFANSDREWFDQAPYPHLREWLENWTSSDAFKHLMKKRPIWKEGNPPIYFPDLTLPEAH